MCFDFCDLCLLDIDGDVDDVYIKAPDRTLLETTRPVAGNGGAVRVQFSGNSEGAKSASAPVRSGKLKKQRVAPREYVRPREWKFWLRYETDG